MFCQTAIESLATTADFTKSPCRSISAGEGISTSIHAPQSYDFFSPPARPGYCIICRVPGGLEAGPPNQPSRARVAFPQKRSRRTGALSDKIATGGRQLPQPLRAHVSVRPETKRTPRPSHSRLLAPLKRCSSTMPGERKQEGKKKEGEAKAACDSAARPVAPAPHGHGARLVCAE